MIWYIVAFFAGVFFTWKVGFWMIDRVFAKGKQLTHVLTKMSPDSFARLRQAIAEETSRRNSL